MPAGFVNPLNGEGIHYAMFSGDIASEIIMQALVKNDFSEQFLQQYQDTCMKEFGNYLSKCAKLQGNNVNSLRWIIKFGHGNLKLNQLIADLFDETKDPMKITREMIKTLLKEIIRTPFIKKKKSVN